MRTNVTRPRPLRTGLTRTAALAAVLAVSALVPPALAHDRAAAAGERTRAVALGSCEAGRLCLWKKPDFAGARHTFELSDTDIESCVPLPKGGDAQSLANRTGRPVTTYQSAECAETGEFETGKGSTP
ncbi:peptidase inhibitor family I36 protein [Streptomyces sindenensis]|uniref:peptidase inhibitor family I36 protein n=1 Tax=Streptomyces sindenensis TaxID=67363 RepID=UPI0036CA4C21